MDKVSFYKFDGDVFKTESNRGFVLDKETKDWRPVTVGVMAEVFMYGHEIAAPSKGKVTFIKSEGQIFKSESTKSGYAAFFFDTKTNKWHPTSIGALTEAEMYGHEIAYPALDAPIVTSIN